MVSAIPFNYKNGDLTMREREVLKLLVDGMTYKLIASELNVAIDTVRSHIKNIYSKLNVNSKSEAVVKALRNGDMISQMTTSRRFVVVCVRDGGICLSPKWHVGWLASADSPTPRFAGTRPNDF